MEVMPDRSHSLSFINDIVPIFTRADCANSNCHGSVRGQKGFKLSLFGSDPELDYDAITKNSDGRRIDRERCLESGSQEADFSGSPRLAGSGSRLGRRITTPCSNGCRKALRSMDPANVIKVRPFIRRNGEWSG